MKGGDGRQIWGKKGGELPQIHFIPDSCPDHALRQNWKEDFEWQKTLARATQCRKDPWIPTEKICANVTLLQDSTSQLLTVSNIEEVKLAQFDPKVT